MNFDPQSHDRILHSNGFQACPENAGEIGDGSW